MAADKGMATCRLCCGFCEGGKPDSFRMNMWVKFCAEAIVPWNARVHVNNTTGDYMRFEHEGRKYSVDVVKKAHRTFIKGADGISQKKPVPAADEMGADPDADAVEAEMLVEHTKGVALNRAEQDKVNAMVLGYNMEFGGTPFVHFLTSTNIVAGNMKIPLRVAKKLGIPKQGMLAARLGTGGRKTGFLHNQQRPTHHPSQGALDEVCLEEFP